MQCVRPPGTSPVQQRALLTSTSLKVDWAEVAKLQFPTKVEQDKPGSGKSSLTKLLSGRFPKDKSVTIQGQVVYNGTPTAELHRRLPQFVAYVPQREKHYPELTVKETLEFAHAACGGELSERDASRLVNGSPEENTGALEAARAMTRHHPDVVIQQLGLENITHYNTCTLRASPAG
ncbi:hypothetical protein PR003_g23904 [Phytophthora rubi]|uniref:ABC transporter domain-containing protein n=1 Tax=Phytophthora rubi TaxID=129364 RepID=A0A6A4CSQ7_9STRA|nr:hypothetical protein PR003_g23904 [Phytophthora rubi]